MARNPEWYNLNEQRPWPLDDTALLTDDTGAFLPHNLISDVMIRFPRVLGDRLFLGAVTVGPNVVTATFLSASAGYIPVASISVPRPVDVYRHYALETLYPGVAGWIVFGGGIDNTQLRTYRFSSPVQSLIQLQSARQYIYEPVESLGKLNVATGLTGLIRLSAGSDLEIVKEEREIEGTLRDAIVLRLVADAEQGERNIFEEYAGPCGKRPESRNCGAPEPIEFINNVAPDCCGNILIELHGCLAISKDVESCSIVLDCGFGLGEACPTGDRLPDATGRLPNEYDDLCEGSLEISLSLSDDSDITPVYEELVSGDGDTLTSLPVTVNFEDVSTGDMDTLKGTVAVGADAYSGYSAFFSDGGGVNLLAFNADSPTGKAGWTTFYKQVSTTFCLRAGDIGSLHNAGIVLNYRQTTGDPAIYEYWLVEATWDDVKQLRIRYFNGLTFTSIAEIAIPTLQLDNRYTLTTSVLPVGATSDGAWISATLTGIDDALNAAAGPTYVSNYRPAEGTVGLFSNRSASEFSTITVANNPVT